MANSPPRDLVRFSPFGFSLAVAAVILLVAGGFATGYLWGVRGERIRASAAVPATVIIPSLDLPSAAQTSAAAGSAPTVTFYSELAGETKKPPGSFEPKTPQQPPLPSRKEASQGTVTAQQKEPTASKPSPSGAAVRPSEGSVPSAKPKGLMVQVASYPAASQAQEMRNALERKGFRCEVQEADLGIRGRWYRVRIGPFKDPSQAQQAIARVQREMALKGYIVP